jgi:hypothetical protein
MGREAPRERRAHLFQVIEKMTLERPKGESGHDADVAHLCRIAGLSRASFYRAREPNLSRRDPPSP